MQNTKNSQNQSDLIKQRIKELHDRGSGDFQTLFRQVKKNQKVIQLNVPQMVTAMARQKTVVAEMGRGTGKTTGRGERWSRILKEMPRSTGLFIGPSYQAILTRIVPSLVQGLEMFGLYRNLHYFIGQQPPRSWRKHWGVAYQPPAKYDRYITFYNGVGVHLISQEVAGDGRGLNSDWIDGDEAALLSGEKLNENTDPTLRGTNTFEFKNASLFGSRFYSSTTPLTPEGKWFTDYEEKARMYPNENAFISATCKWNMHNLRPGYLEEARRNSIYVWVYEAEYDNKRPKFTKDAFYTLLDPDIHLYTKYNYSHYTEVGQSIDCRGDKDLTPSNPLILGVDWGASINCLTVNQYLRSINEYRTLKDMYVLGSDQEIQDDLFKKFIDYYQYHQPNNKDIFLYYDNTGNNKTGITVLTRAELAKKQLEAAGWNVRLMTDGGTNPHHDKKHLIWERILSGDTRHLPTYQMNKENCPYLYISMKHAKTKQGSKGEIKKDKRSESSSKIARQYATDLSDANDAPIIGMFGHMVQHDNYLLPDTT